MQDVLRIDAWKIVRHLTMVLVGFSLVLLACDLAVAYGVFKVPRALQKIFNVAREDGLGNWLSCGLTLALAGVVALHAIRLRGKDHRWERRSWWLLSAFFLYASADDGAKMHERIGSAVKDSAEAMGQVPSLFDSFPTYTWHLVFGPLLLVVGLVILGAIFRRGTHKRSRWLLLLGLSFLALAVGLDFAEGIPKYAGWESFAFLGEENRLTRHTQKAIEEVLEMLGFSCLLGGFLYQALHRFPSWSIETGEEQGAALAASTAQGPESPVLVEAASAYLAEPALDLPRWEPDTGGKEMPHPAA